ncbi:UNVERIFIED_CONTAM: hypothetical protein PYX00_004990 [Menopon gallinae]|uniref:Elongation of very long chain fatty acids protein n=1 Tax=Menopon gallinae TaxID=328185 RepID=A0AAW2I6M9_9NEOP
MSNATAENDLTVNTFGDSIVKSDFLGISYITNSYNNFMNRTVDPRTKEWFLVDNPLPLLLILTTYLAFCTKIGPRIMRNRKPLKLTEVLMVYNVIQVIVSIIIFHEGLMGGWLFHYNYKCQPVDYSDNPVARRMATAVWYYYMCKIIELLDTVFFVLRKKDNQVSFLHLYHHTLMPVCAWIGVKWLPGGHGTLLGVINSFVHIVMYTYYLLAALGPQYQKYLWWKKYLTSMQIIQFIIIIAHASQLFIYDCNYPKIMIAILGLNTVFILVLFTMFYINSYVRNTKVKAN